MIFHFVFVDFPLRLKEKQIVHFLNWLNSSTSLPCNDFSEYIQCAILHNQQMAGYNEIINISSFEIVLTPRHEKYRTLLGHDLIRKIHTSLQSFKTLTSTKTSVGGSVTVKSISSHSPFQSVTNF